MAFGNSDGDFEMLVASVAGRTLTVPRLAGSRAIRLRVRLGRRVVDRLGRHPSGLAQRRGPRLARLAALVRGLAGDLGLALAHLMNRHFFGHTVVQTIILLPLMVAPVIASMMMRWIFNDQFGAVNRINPQLVLADVFLFERRMAARQVPQIFHCSANARATLTDDLELPQPGAAPGKQWTPLDASDELLLAVCDKALAGVWQEAH